MTGEHPEDWSAPVDQEDIAAAIEAIDAEAADHNAEYAAGMRRARTIIEEKLEG